MRIGSLILCLWLSACGGDPQSTPDLATDDAGKKAFGEVCNLDSECESNICYHGNMRFFCTMKCTAATAATDCPIPPTTGICNMQGYCKP